MATSLISSNILIANPTLDAHPERYSSHDGATNINRFAQQLRFFLPWVKIEGQIYEVRGHDPSVFKVAADFYDHAATTIPTITSEYPYEFDDVPPNVSTPGPSKQLSLKEIVARFDSRDFAQNLLSRQFNQIEFQKRALKHAILSRLEYGLIRGNATAAAAQFDGLDRLVALGLGQSITAAAADELNILNVAMTRIRSHNRRVDLIVMNQDAWLRVLHLQRARGFAPQFRMCRKLRQRILHIDGVPVCLSDHIPTTDVAGGAKTSHVYFLSLGKPNGVFGLLSRRKPSIFFTKTSLDTSPFHSYEAHMYCALASTTTDALVKVADWTVTLGAG